jgi:hypothetical protein
MKYILNVLCVLCTLCGFSLAADKPNILVILADDKYYH